MIFIVIWVIFNESWGDFDYCCMVDVFCEFDLMCFIDIYLGINFELVDQGKGDFIDLYDYFGLVWVNWQFGCIVVFGEYGGNSLCMFGYMYWFDFKCCYYFYDSQEVVMQVYVNQVVWLCEYVVIQGLSVVVYIEMIDVEEEFNGFFIYDCQVRKLDFDCVCKVNCELIWYGC